MFYLVLLCIMNSNMQILQLLFMSHAFACLPSLRCFDKPFDRAQGALNNRKLAPYASAS